ncbi:MAG TPA: hypothetical protein VD713_03735 [Sphingomonadales bacterium]|nr:hypothetical protein [Sphingomonadales bacterium]
MKTRAFFRETPRLDKVPVDEVIDAEFLLRFAIERGEKIDTGVIRDITALSQLREAPADLVEDITRFRSAYRQLSEQMAPVTATTIKNCLPAFGREYGIPKRKMSIAEIQARKLWYYTWITLLFVFLLEAGNQMLVTWYPLDDLGEASVVLVSFYKFFFLFGYLSPFFFGLLGACAYLLRATHYFMGNYIFDRARIPEYFNRMLLGFIGGGTIKLFVQNVAGDDGTAVTLSASALGFLTGYNIDFLFKAIERISEALLPKVGTESMAKAKPPLAPPPPSVKDVGELLVRATDPADKAAFRKMMESLAGKL